MNIKILNDVMTEQVLISEKKKKCVSEREKEEEEKICF